MTTAGDEGLRGRLRKVTDKGREVADTVTGRDDLLGSTLRTGRDGVKATTKKVGEAAGAVSDGIASKLTMDTYRREVDAALDEALRVIAAQEARIAALERQLAERDE